MCGGRCGCPLTNGWRCAKRCWTYRGNGKVVSIDFPADAIQQDLRVVEREIPRIMRRSVSTTLRASRQAAGMEMRQRSGLRPGSVNRRVKAYPATGRVWVGATPPQVLSLRSARRTSRRGVILDGQRLPGVFTAPGVGAGRVALQRLPPPAQGVGVYRLDRYPPLEQAARRAILAARLRAGEVMPAEVERQILVAIRERGA